MKTLLIALCLCASVAKAQALPAVRVPSEDNEFRVDVAAVGTAWTMDTISTHMSHTDPTAYEHGQLFNGSRSTPKIMGAWAVVDVGAIILSHEWKLHVTNKWLHPLWRVPLLVSAGGHGYAAIDNWKH